MFCDVIDSMAIGERIDTEDLLEVLLAYRKNCIEILERAHGQVEQFFGDGILAVFGLPVAREDDAKAAVNAALEICRRMPLLSLDLQRRHGVTLSVRIGVHTGPVVIDATIPGPASQQNRVVGNALNIGARLQQLAPRNGVVISQETYNLVYGHFITETDGPQSIKGISQEVHVYRVVGPSSLRSVFDARLARGLSPLMGREMELAVLESEWTTATGGVPRSVLLTGDPGIGKSRLLYEFQRCREQDECVRIVCYCSAQYQSTAFYPIANELARLFLIEPGDDRDVRLRKIMAGLLKVGLVDAKLASAIDWVFAEAGSDAPLERRPNPETARSASSEPTNVHRRVIRALASYVAAAASRIPLLLIFEDLHWADPSTLEFLRHLYDGLSQVPVLVLSSVRKGVEFDFRAHRSVALDRIPPKECEALIAAIAAGNLVPRAVVAELVRRSDCVPLFVEELTKSVTDVMATDISAGDRGAALLPSIVPGSLHDSIMARLDSLGPAKEVAQVGALLGRSFRIEVLASVWNGARLTLQTEINHLIDAGILFEHEAGVSARGNGTLEFKHELVRGVANESMVRRQRRETHARIAAALERDFADECTRHAELLAYHHTQAGAADRALPLWELAGAHAVNGSANEEAVTHFTRALELLDCIADMRDRQVKELDLNIRLAAPLMASKGYGALEVDRTVARAMTLSREIGDPSRVFPLMYGRWSFDQVTGKVRRSHELAQQYFDIAEASGDAESQMIACRLLGTSLQVTGQPAAAAAHLVRAESLFDEDRHTQLAYRYGSDVKVVIQCSLALARWVLGLDHLADSTIEAAWHRALALGHANTTAYCGSYRLAIAALSGRAGGFKEMVEAHEALLADYQMPVWSATVPCYSGWLHLQQNDAGGAAHLLRQSIAAMKSLDLVYWQPTVWLWLGQALGSLDHFEEAEEAFSQSADLMSRSGECWAEPELFRHWALLRRRSGVAGAEELLGRAQSIADDQGAQAWLIRLNAAHQAVWSENV